MQQELTETYPELKIQIIGMNQIGHESGNPSVTADRTTPWLQDIDVDEDGLTDNWLTSWPYEYRDVVIVDADNMPIDIYNLTVHDLNKPENYATMREMLLDAAQGDVTATWTNPTEPLDVNNDTFISPLDALLILNDLNSVGARELGSPGSGQTPPPFVDTNGDGFISPIDALSILNYLNSISSLQSTAAMPVSAIKGAESPPSEFHGTGCVESIGVGGGRRSALFAGRG